MHLLQAEAGAASDGSEPVDPDQTPADIVFLSAADTDLAALSAARRALANVAETGAAPPPASLRLANLTWLTHPYAVDLYLEKTALKSKLVVARILGGEGYWSYGLEQFSARLAAAGVPFAALPGDDKPDPGLAAASTVAQPALERLWAYVVEGGPDNARHFLETAAALAQGADDPLAAAPAPAPLLRAGFYWPGRGVVDPAALATAWAESGAAADAPLAPLVFYRALLQGGGLQPVDRLAAALLAQGLRPAPVFVASLKDPVSAATLAGFFARHPPAVTLNATGFAAGALAKAGGVAQQERAPTPLDAPGRPVLQVVFSGGAVTSWESGAAGLSARDIAMNVALPEVDGRILTRAVSFKGEAYRDAATQCAIATYKAREDRCGFVARLAAAWARLGATAPSDRRVAVVLANYPTKDGRIANGVGLDTPASAVAVLAALQADGYAVRNLPADGAALMTSLTAGPTNWRADRAERRGGVRYDLQDYAAAYAETPEAFRAAVDARWGPAAADPFVENGAFRLAIHDFGAAVVALQPARGYDVEPEETYHSPDLPPPHHYIAFYAYLRRVFGAHAVVHLGKHGTLEWLPGKAIALSDACAPEAVFGPTPHFYPFIVNDPGEGTQAKRRAQAVIVGHMTPPLTRAETYGALSALEALVDEYYEAAGVDPRRTARLAQDILDLAGAERLDADAGVADADDAAARLTKIDAYLCTLKESQIRNGLHIFGRSPQDDPNAADADGGSAAFLETDLLVALTRAPRNDGVGPDASLIRALAEDLLGPPGEDGFDPLDAAFAAPWRGPRPKALASTTTDVWRTGGDTVERLEMLAQRLVAGATSADDLPGPLTSTRPVLAQIDTVLKPTLRRCGAAEINGLLVGLDGRFTPPGPSGAPTRGRLDVLPTGRNFYSVDSRAVPTPTAWRLGWASAALLIERHLQDAGEWLRAVALTAWGTACMRTGGDDLAQGLALMGVRPRWDAASRRVIGFEILPLSVLDRPRVDVTLRISGFFRDAFPAQVDLFQSAAAAVSALDEPAAQNPAAARRKAESERLCAGSGLDAKAAFEQAGYRVFGAKPGAYGAGLQALIDERAWSTRADLADAFLTWSGYAYGAGAEGEAARPALERRLAAVDAVVQNQDNHEHDLLDSDDYYQFEGGLAASVESLTGAAPRSYHNDHSRPERPVIRTLEEEIARVVRARVANPKWIGGVKRHGYKGAFEIAATVDYLFAFAAATNAVKNHHFDIVYDAVLGDEDTRGFIAEVNPAALSEIEERLREAIARDLWSPRRNAVRGALGV